MTETIPKVSIIVPVYNAEKVLVRCIDSILQQDYKNFELILADDGSTDTSGSICDEYAKRDRRIKVMHKANSGVSDTRNCALNVARGPYIQFVDADDWITPYATRLLVEALEKNQCDMVISDFYRVSKERVSHKGAIDLEGVLTREEFASEMMENPADFYYGVLWNKLFRREIIEEYQLRMLTEISWCEDFLFNLEYMRFCERIFVLQVPIYYYVKTKGSLVSQGLSVSKTIKMKLMVFEYYHEFYKNVFPEEEYERKRIQLYRFFLDMASDGIVLPMIPGTKKLGDERPAFKLIEVENEGVLSDLYYQRRMYLAYLEPASIKYELSMEETLVLNYLSLYPKCKNLKELSEFMGMPIRHMNMILNKLEQKKYVEVKKRKGMKCLDIRFEAKGNSVIREFHDIESVYKEKMNGGDHC